MSKPKEPIRTNYSEAWLKFRKSKEYKEVWEVMKGKGFKQKYANNVLRVAFDAAWGNQKIFITNRQTEDK